jgi:hypothetical protein
LFIYVLTNGLHGKHLLKILFLIIIYILPNRKSNIMQIIHLMLMSEGFLRYPQVLLGYLKKTIKIIFQNMFNL